MKKVGLNPELLIKPEGFIPWVLFNDLLEIIAENESCHYFGLLVGKYQPAMSVGILGPILKFSPDVRTAIEKGMHYVAAFTHAAYWESCTKGGFITVSRKPRYAQREVYGQSNTLGIIQTLKILQTLCGPDSAFE